MAQVIPDADVIERKNSLEMMRRPWLWPNWPFLPLKRGKDLAFLHNSDVKPPGEEPTLHFHTGLMFFATATSLANAPLADIRQLVNDGWVVD